MTTIENTESTETGPIVLTDEAVTKVAGLLADEDDENLGLRIAVRPGGCSGFAYEMFFDADTAPDDHVSTYGTVVVKTDPASAKLLTGATLHYRDGLQEAGFSIDNPNAQRSCGCGQSFS